MNAAFRRSAIRDAKYWDIELATEETPLATDDIILCHLRTEDGFIVEIELQDRCFHANVTLPDGFHHDTERDVDLWDDTLQFSITQHKYSWTYRLDYYVDLFYPRWAQDLHPRHKIAGPVQILDDARGFIRELRANKHTGPVDTFHKNLQYMERLYGGNWEVRPEEGDIMLAPECTFDRSIMLRTVEGFTVNIGWSPRTRCLVANIGVPRDSLHQTTHEDIRVVQKPAACDAVKLLKRARQIIKEVMRQDAEVARIKKSEMIRILREELMMEACHPRRIAAWCEAGFDPFE